MGTTSRTRLKSAVFLLAWAKPCKALGYSVIAERAGETIQTEDTQQEETIAEEENIR
jgi:hypothetical protein